MRSLLWTNLFVGSILLLTQCSKKNCCGPDINGNQKLNYGDSIFYLKNTDYSISPLGGRTGTYTAFPDNLQIDKTTGKINVTVKGNDGESQTGLWYRIIYKSSDSKIIDSTYILLAGISYVDKFYHLNQNDSIIYPIYNGDPANAAPTGNYDLAHDDKFAINPANGQINLKECMRRGFFASGGTTPNTSWKIASIKYELNDKSNRATNKIDIVVYYYHTLNEVPSNVSALMQAHQQMTLGLRTLPSIPSTTGAIDNYIPSDLSLSKPRPPCVIIVGN
jgi:hypothetical protein